MLSHFCLSNLLIWSLFSVISFFTVLCSVKWLHMFLEHFEELKLNSTLLGRAPVLCSHCTAINIMGKRPWLAKQSHNFSTATKNGQSVLNSWKFYCDLSAAACDLRVWWGRMVLIMTTHDKIKPRGSQMWLLISLFSAFFLQPLKWEPVVDIWQHTFFQHTVLSCSLFWEILDIPFPTGFIQQVNIQYVKQTH